ncbi:MAG: exodeoxyribonuclease VII small subunit [Muribaculaceae bacterium]|nr:exodeoxyribonuclease VII small subunit [Muribaculaceae bacterium]
MKYTEAIAELESILSSMRSENCDIDTLAARTKRAGELLEQCRASLTATEEELEAILSSIAPPSGSEA